MSANEKGKISKMCITKSTEQNYTNFCTYKHIDSKPSLLTSRALQTVICQSHAIYNPVLIIFLTRALFSSSFSPSWKSASACKIGIRQSAYSSLPKQWSKRSSVIYPLISPLRLHISNLSGRIVKKSQQRRADRFHHEAIAIAVQFNQRSNDLLPTPCFNPLSTLGDGWRAADGSEAARASERSFRPPYGCWLKGDQWGTAFHTEWRQWSRSKNRYNRFGATRWYPRERKNNAKRHRSLTTESLYLHNAEWTIAGKQSATHYNTTHVHKHELLLFHPFAG